MWFFSLAELQFAMSSVDCRQGKTYEPKKTEKQKQNEQHPIEFEIEKFFSILRLTASNMFSARFRVRERAT